MSIPSESDSMAAVAKDFQDILAADGVTVTWEQRQVTGTDKYGNPIVKFNATPIKVLIRATEPVEVRLTEPGFVMEQYLTIQYDPAYNIAILDRIIYLGNVYEVRAFLPTSAAETKIYSRARLKQIVTPLPG
jgi:hypothetical protein